MPEPAVPTADELLIRPSIEGPWNGAGGYEIAAGWLQAAPRAFDATPSGVSWTDGKQLFVGRDFRSGTALGVAPAPQRWQSDTDGLWWTNDAGELWNAHPGFPPRLVWRCPGRAEAFALGGTAIYLALATGGAADGSTLPVDAPREIWRVVKATSESARVSVSAGYVRGMVATGEDLYFTDQADRVHHVRGAAVQERDGARTLTGLFAVDERYVYGGDRSYLYRAPRDGGAATAIAHFGEWGATLLSSDAYAVLDAGQLYWIEGSGLFTAPAAGGRATLLADFEGTVDRLVPAGDAVYVRESGTAGGGARVLRVPKRGTPAARATAAQYERVFNFTAHGARTFWLVGDKLWASDDVGEPTQLATLDHAVDSMLVANDQHVYFTTSDEILWRVPALGGVPEKVADWQELLPRPSGGDGTSTCCEPAPTVAMDAQHVYFVSRTRGALARIGKDGVNGRGAQVMARELGRPRALRVDDQRAYVVADGDVSTSCHAQLAAVPKAGGAVTSLAKDLACGTSLALTTTTVWTAGVGQPLRRIPKAGGEATEFPLPPATEVVALTGEGDTLYVSIPTRILKLNETTPLPSVLVSGLLNPPTAFQVEGRTLFFIDARAEKGIPNSRLQRVDLAPR